MRKVGTKEQRNIDYYMQLPYSILLHQIEDEYEKYYIAEVVELPGCKSHGSTVEEAVRNVEEAKRDWILDGLDRGEEIPLPVERQRFSGKTLLRMPRSLHRALALIADSENLSLNQLIVTILAKEVGSLHALNRVEEKLDNLANMKSSQLKHGPLDNVIQYLGSMAMMAGTSYYSISPTDLITLYPRADLRPALPTDDALTPTLQDVVGIR